MDVPGSHQTPKETQSPLAKTAAATKNFRKANEMAQVKPIKPKPVGHMTPVNSIQEDAMPKYGVKVDKEEEVDKVRCFVHERCVY